eukprot:TRINITY_DN2995_c0_g1_i7.p1 TRINITY_DN2995_c0_g1~~TRINITY_DN2995_c0_g1_i7.p1  ORF type:complete len:369 (-),score=26.53 TRINITY_DN2995_c0_g1_i7:531-1613(-)
MSLSNNFLKKQRCNFFTRYSNTITGFRWKVQGCVLSRRPPLRSIYCCATKEIVKETKKEKKGSKPKQEKLTGEDEIRQVRIEKVAGLRKAELNPYAYNFDRTHFAQALQDEYKDLPSGEAVTLDNEVSVCGRIMSRRVMGKLAFANLRDESGSIQLYMDKKGMQQVQEGAFANMKAFLDVGDIVGVKGNIKRTEKGELSVLVTKFQILTKTLLPLPDKWHGLTDVEKRYRQRYLDMIVTPGVADTFRTRAKITSAIRRYLESLGFSFMSFGMNQVEFQGKHVPIQFGERNFLPTNVKSQFRLVSSFPPPTKDILPAYLAVGFKERKYQRRSHRLKFNVIVKEFLRNTQDNFLKSGQERNF